MSRAQRDSDIGIVCPKHGLQAGRTRCRWCNFDPLKVSSLRLDAGLPRTFTGDRGAFIQSGQQGLPDVSGNVFHQKILPHSEVETG